MFTSGCRRPFFSPDNGPCSLLDSRWCMIYNEYVYASDIGPTINFVLVRVDAAAHIACFLYIDFRLPALF